MIHHGNLFDVLPTLEAESVDACVTDPPYDLTSGKRGGTGAASLNLDSPAGRSRISTGGGFMGKEWDATGVAFNIETWRQVLRVLKPGGYLLAFGGTRTSHRMVCAIEDSGFEIRDSLSWMFGSGFPKSLNLGNGRGTALKPAYEPICMARKPLRGTVAANVARYGTGAINVDACRIGLGGEEPPTGSGDRRGSLVYAQDRWTQEEMANGGNTTSSLGRWPANVILDPVSAAMLDEQTGELVSGANPTRRSSDKFRDAYGEFKGQTECFAARGVDVGGASRFYYVAKPSREERDYGCEGLRQRSGGEATDRTDGSAGVNSPRAGAGRTGGSRNVHPTVKPVELMRWLVKLVTPLDGLVLDPFTGSGTTGMACRYELRRFIGIERDAEYVRIAEARIAAVAPLFGEAAV